jgi:SPP1 gp7 family putative phage head morphogenesis protein
MNSHEYTDAEIERLERELKSLYSETYSKLEKQIRDALDKWQFGPEMTPQQRYIETMKYNRLKAMQAQISESLANTNTEAIKIINGSNVNVYKKAFNDEIAGFKEAEPNSVFPTINKNLTAKILRNEVSPFRQLAIDSALNRKAIEQTLTRSLLSGIMLGESTQKLTKRIQEQYNGNRAQAARIARTEASRIENAAKQDAFDVGEKKGLKIEKTWIATKDPRTRDTHKEADGQTVSNDKPFIVGGEKLMYPGDEAGSAWNVINCRCTIVAKVLKNPNVKTSGILYSDDRADSYETKIDKTFDYNAADIQAELHKAETEIRTSNVENAYVYSSDGKAYRLTGSKYAVDLEKIGADVLKGATVTHNHPYDERGPSKEDLFTAARTKISELRTVDRTRTYVFRFDRVTEEDINANIKEAQAKMFERRYEGEDGEDQAMIAEELAKLIKGLSYETY